MTDEEIERIEALVVRASAWAASRPLVSALSALLAERKELLRRVEEAEAENRQYAENLGDIVTYGTTADVLDMHLGDAIRERDTLRAQLAEAQALLSDTVRLHTHRDPEHYCWRENLVTGVITVDEGPMGQVVECVRKAKLAEVQAAQERAVAEAWEAGREAAAQACDEQARRLVNSETDTGDGEVWLRHASAAIRALAPKVT